METEKVLGRVSFLGGTFGLFPYRKNYVITVTSLLYFLSHLCLLTYFVFSYVIATANYEELGLILDILDKIQMLGAYFCFVFNVLGLNLKIRNSKWVDFKLILFEIKLFRENIKVEYEKNYFFLFLPYCLTLATFFYEFIANEFEFSSFFSLYAFYHVTLTSFSLIFIFSSYMGIITKNFEVLRDSLFFALKNERYGNLNFFVSKYHELFEIAYSLNKPYGLTFLSIISNLFLQTVISLYLMKDNSNDPWSKDRITRLLILVTYSGQIFLLVWPVEKAKDASKKFERILESVVVNKERRNPLLIKVLDKHLLIKERLEFYAFGFFKIDYQLIHTIVAGMISYLIILWQSFE